MRGRGVKSFVIGRVPTGTISRWRGVPGRWVVVVARGRLSAVVGGAGGLAVVIVNRLDIGGQATVTVVDGLHLQ